MAKKKKEKKTETKAVPIGKGGWKVSLIKGATFSDGTKGMRYEKGKNYLVDDELAESLKASGQFKVVKVSVKGESEEE